MGKSKRVTFSKIFFKYFNRIRERFIFSGSNHIFIVSEFPPLDGLPYEDIDDDVHLERCHRHFETGLHRQVESLCMHIVEAVLYQCRESNL